MLELEKEFPAPAGINRGGIAALPACRGVPRASGDKPWAQLMYSNKDMSSPRQRG
ncbi:hypothetical protein L913_3246 [Escherichia coli SCD2]|nr:hypothetical protein L913_3246 [Escherichia coli SCD2]KEJ11168.1 hypothetical protein AB50_3119 [Escherichia coli 6-175-07_S1_C2]KEM51937.1 hypothetical protein AB79_3282 [Escherichia coli 6-175-07_S1_C3]